MLDDAKLIARFPAGEVLVPPSKSLSHRAAICAGLAALGGGGESLLHNLGQSQDIAATLGCMAALGVRYAPEAGGLRVAAGFPRAPEAPAAPAAPAAPEREITLDCGESGSTLRFLIPLAAVLGGAPYRFTGRGRLMARPLDAYRRIFQEKGLRFQLSPGAGTLTVQGPLPGGRYALPGDVSSQFVSGLLLALPLAAENSVVEVKGKLESAGYVALTLEVMRGFGVTVAQPGPGRFSIPGKQAYRGAEYTVEGDWSQAAFFLAAGALGQPVRCAGLPAGSAQGDAAIAEILESMGVAVHREGDRVWATPGRPRAADIDVRDVPDLVPPLAALCCLARGTSRITGAGRLRLKESDRLDALAAELAALGAEVTQGPDSLTITGQPALAGGAVQAHGDHRIAMALAVAAIGCAGPVRLAGWRCVDKSYPSFWDDFEKAPR